MVVSPARNESRYVALIATAFCKLTRISLFLLFRKGSHPFVQQVHGLHFSKPIQTKYSSLEPVSAQKGRWKLKQK
jgi:hypothetical protein